MENYFIDPDVEEVKERTMMKHIDKGNRFKAVLYNFSNSKKFPQVMSEWDIKLERNNGLLTTYTCICSQKIRTGRGLYIMNRHTGKYIAIGSNCLQNYGSEVMLKDWTTLNKIIGYKGENKLCFYCCNYRANIKSLYCANCRRNSTTTISRIIQELLDSCTKQYAKVKWKLIVRQEEINTSTINNKIEFQQILLDCNYCSWCNTIFYPKNFQDNKCDNCTKNNIIGYDRTYYYGNIKPFDKLTYRYDANNSLL